jgi:hypothetical protein
LLFEYAIRCLLSPSHEIGYWAYQTARHYAERYDSHYGTGLIPASLPLVEDIAGFWSEVLGIDLTAASSSVPKAKKETRKRPPTSESSLSSGLPKDKRGQPAFSERQGQFLAFIHFFRKLHRQGPSEKEIAQYFQLTPPAVHGMIVKLEQLGLATREPGVARSVQVVIPEEKIPVLQSVEGAPW